MEPEVLYEERGLTALVSLNRPEKRNALSIEVCRQLREAYARFERDDSLKVMVLTGAGEKAFCAGYDIKEKTGGRVATERDFAPRVATEMFVSKPVIAAVNGGALAAGMALVEACDLVVASENAWFSLPEVTLGIGVQPFVQSLWTLPQHVLMELLLTGEPLTAKRAFELGFVSRLYSQDQLIPGVLALAEVIAANAPLVVKASKAMIYKGIEAMGNSDALEAARRLFLPVQQSEDAKEGFRARAEGRPPEWKGA